MLNKHKYGIILADDHTIMREGVRALLENDASVEVVGGACSGRETLRMCRDLKPDLVIMDVTMPDLNGVEAAAQITREFPGVKVLALSMHSSKNYVLRMLRAGASGYLVKQSAFCELSRAIKVVAQGKTYLSPEVAGLVVDELVQNSIEDQGAECAQLTAREKEVLQLLAEGNGVGDIASKLCISQPTVYTHRRNLMAKVGVKNLAQLIKFAIREGLTDLSI